jgi:hypothetical protein
MTELGTETKIGSEDKFKLIHNSKGYNWEFQIIKTEGMSWDDVLAQMKKLNPRDKSIK